MLLCLGINPAVVAAQSSAAAARSDCRFLDDAAMGAAVTRAAGKTHTVTQHLEGKDASYGCEYRFGSVKDRVMVRYTKIRWDPAQAQVFTLDGLRAYYSPGEGDRAVGVEIGGGVFSVVVWMSDPSDAFSKKVAIEVFRAARPKVA
ncbi:hypothetical protein [Dactylosporangium sp. NPDC050588]|uniref:hypothetical protein n=1 Tax=Dactylosporangium sp. NPDC050588 TaxID=3157211 RepID=UPI00340A3AEA